MVKLCWIHTACSGTGDVRASRGGGGPVGDSGAGERSPDAQVGSRERADPVATHLGGDVRRRGRHQETR